jgi:hypothetical protein
VGARIWRTPERSPDAGEDLKQMAAAEELQEKEGLELRIDQIQPRVADIGEAEALTDT